MYTRHKIHGVSDVVTELTAVIARQNGAYVAACVELGINTVGKSVEEARDRLIDAIQHHIDDACETASTSNTNVETASENDILLLLEQARKGEGILLKLPEYLITRN